MNIGIIPDPLNHPDWPKIKAFLEPAAKLGGVPVLDNREAVWAVYQGQLVAAATARLTDDQHGEIILCGGVGAKQWAMPLADLICRWFKDEGMKAAHIYGRRGWMRLLEGWAVIGEADNMTGYKRAL